MENKAYRFLLICMLFTVIGLAGGYAAAKQTSSAEDPHKEGGKEQKHEEEDEDKITLSPEALLNLGVLVEGLPLSDYNTFRSVPAVIEETPKTVQPVFAPIGGLVQEIKVKHGSMTKGGAVIISLLRDAIKLPELKLTGQLLDPEQRLKGLTVAEISSIEDKAAAEKQTFLWQVALKRNGYWPERAKRIHQFLPKAIQQLPLTVASIGELSASGYLSKELELWMKLDWKVGLRFIEIASLLCEGKSLLYVKQLYKLKALNPIVEIEAPTSAKDWDVHGIYVKPGEHIEAGKKIATLHNSRELHLVVHAKGSEIPMLMKALEKDLSMMARPLTEAAGPLIEGLKILNVQDDGDKEEGDGAVIHLEVFDNTFISKNDKTGQPYRSWKIRAGMKYMLRVPQKILKEVFVLPRGSVVEDGADKVIFVQNGDSFDVIKVVVIHEDHEAVVFQARDLFPDDPVVRAGAFGLGLALKANSAQADPHAGHNHPH